MLFTYFIGLLLLAQIFFSQWVTLLSDIYNFISMLAHICTFYSENKIRKKIFFKSKLNFFSMGHLLHPHLNHGIYARQENAAQILKNEKYMRLFKTLKRTMTNMYAL